MPGESEITQFDVIVFVHEHVMTLDISVNDAMPMQVGDDSDHLHCNLLPFCLAKVDLSFMDQVKQSALLDQLHSDT